MPSDFTQIVEDRIDNLILYLREKARTPAFKPPEARIVDSDYVVGELQDIIACLPNDIRRANSILRERQHIIELAHDEADRIVDDADRMAEKIIENANNEAQTTINDANRYNSRVTSEADEYSNEKHAEADNYYDERINEAEEYNEGRHNEADVYYDEKTRRADEDAQRIIDEAEMEAERLVSESEIIREATERAEALRRSALARANKVYNNAKILSDRILGELMQSLEHYYEIANEDREKLAVRNSQRDDTRNDKEAPEVHNEAVRQREPIASENVHDEESDYYDEYEKYSEADEHEASTDAFSRIGAFFRGVRRNDEDDK